jgi:hypothetical protein
VPMPAMAPPLAPARSERAIRVDRMVFMAVLLQ